MFLLCWVQDVYDDEAEMFIGHNNPTNYCLWEGNQASDLFIYQNLFLKLLEDAPHSLS